MENATAILLRPETLGQVLTDQIGTLSTTFNISHQWVGYALFFSLSFVTFVMTYLWFRSTFFAVLSSVLPIYIGTVLGIIPMWITVFFSFIYIYTVLSIIRGVPDNAEVITETNGSEWDEYGLKLKNAYSAKFGGENNGFNEEVDHRIAIMNHNGRGFTRTIAYDWLKRMARFTESK